VTKFTRIIPLKRTLYWTREYGFTQFLKFVVENRLAGKPLESFRSIIPHIRGKYGLEIGGPSGIFRINAPLPIYALAGRIDNVDYASKTIWNRSFTPNELQGLYSSHIVSDATTLHRIPDRKYDFVASSHVLEHIANPLKALFAWNRVLKERGSLILVVPDKKFTFDHRRSVTSFRHLVDDYSNNTLEDDITHLQEVLALHDLTLDPDAGNRVQFELRCKNNYVYRAMHHHVFNHTLLERALGYTGYEVLARGSCPPFHLWTIASKSRHHTDPLDSDR